VPRGVHAAQSMRRPLDKLLMIDRTIAQSQVSLMLGLLGALTGADLATGSMAYEPFVNQMDDTSQSWVLIAPVWVGLAAGLLIGLLAFYAGGYFADVSGQILAGALLLLGSMVVLAAATDREGSQAGVSAATEETQRALR